MPETSRIRASALAVIVTAVLGVAPGPSRADEGAAASRVYVDEDYDFRLTPPPGWQRGNPARITVPGEVCRVWTPDGTTSIVAFVQKPGKAMHPRTLLEASAQTVEKAGSEIVEQEVRSVAGMQAMSLVLEGDGTGGAVVAKGAVRTRQHWFAVPRETDVVVLLLTTPADGWTITQTAFQAMLDTLHLGGRQTGEQRQAEPSPPAEPEPEPAAADQPAAAPEP